MVNETKPERRDRRVMGRPVERTGSYQRITLEVRTDLLAKLDASHKSRRQFVEELLETSFSESAENS